jgi:hypothetical protein
MDQQLTEAQRKEIFEALVDAHDHKMAVWSRRSYEHIEVSVCPG